MIVALAEQRISVADRDICMGMVGASGLSGEVTELESKAVTAYLDAIHLECRRAGYGSPEDFQRSYCGGSVLCPPAATNRKVTDPLATVVIEPVNPRYR
jgi:hypothetical protein